jgi:hypothetical protein
LPAIVLLESPPRRGALMAGWVDLRCKTREIGRLIIFSEMSLLMIV